MLIRTGRTQMSNENMTDAGNALRLVAQYGGQFATSHNWTRWAGRDGTMWNPTLKV